VSDNFTCPLCGFEDDINGFFTCSHVPFPTWGSSSTTGARPGSQAFLDSFADWLDQPVAVVQVKLPQG
jgi:hypothetical protein